MKKADAIADTILKRIRTNVYTGKIPGERFLAEEFGVNFKTANRAISMLVEQGTLLRRRGEGTFIAPVNQRRELTIALCFHKYTEPGRDPVFNRFFAGVNSASKSRGLRLDVTALRDVPSEGLSAEQRSVRFEQAVLANNPDGVIYLGNIDIPLIQRLSADRPTIVVAETPDSYGFDSVTRDIRAGTAAAVRHFHAAGHRHIMLLAAKAAANEYDREAKVAGYEDAMRELGLQAQILRGNSFPDEQLIAAIQQATPRPTAVIGIESSYGLVVVQHGPRLGLRIPEDVAVAAFDDGDVGAFTQPRMASIHAFGEDLADVAVQRMVDKLDGRIEGRIVERLPCPFIDHAAVTAAGDASRTRA